MRHVFVTWYPHCINGVSVMTILDPRAIGNLPTDPITSDTDDNTTDRNITPTHVNIDRVVSYSSVSVRMGFYGSSSKRSSDFYISPMLTECWMPAPTDHHYGSGSFTCTLTYPCMAKCSVCWSGMRTFSKTPLRNLSSACSSKYNSATGENTYSIRGCFFRFYFDGLSN